MARLGIFDRDDEGLHIRLRSTRQSARIGGSRLRLGRRAGQHKGLAKAVGSHRPMAVQKGGGGVTAIVKSAAKSPGRTAIRSI